MGHLYLGGSSDTAARVAEEGGSIVVESFDLLDADAAADKAAALGGKIISPPTDGPVARQAALAEPQGAAFSVSKVLV